MQIAELKRALATKDLRLSVTRAELLDSRMQLQVTFSPSKHATRTAHFCWVLQSNSKE